MPKAKVALIELAIALQPSSRLALLWQPKSREFCRVEKPAIRRHVPNDIEVVAAFDIDERKVGKDLSEAIFAEPNNTPRVVEVPPNGIVVNKGPLLDGVGKSTESILKISIRLT